MPRRTQDLVSDGPYGGPGGSAYNATDNENKIESLQTWKANYDGYDVLGAFQFDFEDGTSSGRIGGRDPNIGYTPQPPFTFRPDEKIVDMTFYAGDGQGFCNGFEFDTNKGNHFEAGSKIGLASDVEDLGNGEWAGATGRDNTHGADAVVDSMILYFKE